MRRKLMTSIICSFLVFNLTNTTILTANATDFAPKPFHNVEDNSDMRTEKPRLIEDTKINTLPSNSSDSYYDRDEGNAESGLDENTQILKNAISLLEDAENHMKIAYLKFDSGKYYEAIQDFDKVISLFTECLDTLDRIDATAPYGQFLEKTLNPKEYKQGLSYLYHDRGLAKHRIGRSFEAIQDFDKAIELKPNNESAYINRGNAKAVLGHSSEGIKDMDKAIELNPNDAEAYHFRALLNIQLKQNLLAIQDCDKAIELDPSKTDFYTTRSIAKVMLRQYTEAMKDADKAISLDPNNTKAYELKAWIKRFMSISK